MPGESYGMIAKINGPVSSRAAGYGSCFGNPARTPSSGQRQQKGRIQAREFFTMSFRFHHVHVICKDLEKMIGFFTESIGAELVRRKKFGTADGASLSLKGATLNLRVARTDEKIEGDASQTVYGYNHIGLEVEDIEAAYTDLRSQGYSFFMPPTNIPELRIAFFRGPEDIVIELVQRI